jgi:hypothetical protein
VIPAYPDTEISYYSPNFQTDSKRILNRPYLAAVTDFLPGHSHDTRSAQLDAFLGHLLQDTAYGMDFGLIIVDLILWEIMRCHSKI